jgi:hypothetical protein
MSYQEYLARGKAKVVERYREDRNIEAPNMNDLFEDLASEREIIAEEITMDKPIDSSNIGYRLLVR